MMLQGQAGPMCAEEPSQYLEAVFSCGLGVAGEYACEAPDSREAVSVSAQRWDKGFSQQLWAPCV